MRGTNLEKTRGITLIALVITIIVLLILAGVAIAMLSGENGILEKAAESKTKTENAQNEESQTILGYELAMDNAMKNSTVYRYQSGYITGIQYDDENKSSKNTIQELEDALPEGYKIVYKYNPTTQKDEEITDKTQKIATGMAIVKDGKIVARTVLFGDTDCNGEIDSDDAIEVILYYNYMESVINRDFQKIAGNINEDEELNTYDATEIIKYDSFIDSDVNQNKIIKVSAKKIKKMYKELQQYIHSLDTSTGYAFEYNSEEDTYKLKGVTKGTKVETLINALPESDKIKIRDKDGNAKENNAEIVDGDHIEYTIEHNVTPRFAYIEVK